MVMPEAKQTMNGTAIDQWSIISPLANRRICWTWAFLGMLSVRLGAEASPPTSATRATRSPAAVREGVGATVREGTAGLAVRAGTGAAARE
jgi:hypothetical protein